MRFPTTLKARFSGLFPSSTALLTAPIWALMIGLSSNVFHPEVTHAASPDSAPKELKNTLSQIDQAANRYDIQSLMRFYSPNFTNNDGLNRSGLEKAVTQLWQRYPKLNYRTELQSWETAGNGIVAQTITYINGSQSINDKPMKFEAMVRSRQRFENSQIVQQQILGERTQLTTGSKPPTVDLNLPEQVRLGQEYNLDAIVKEPIGNDLLLGTAIEETIQVNLYTQPKPFDLELLPAGGVFKVGKATKKGNYWISTVLVRSGGMTLITQRLQVVDRISN